MPKSNGRRSVNKTDGPKKKGKKAMTKSRRNDKKKVIEESISEAQPYNELESLWARFKRIFKSV